MDKTMIKILVVYIVAIILLVISVGSLFVKCAAEVNEVGLKNIVNEVWEGKGKDKVSKE